jgi:hypothetical protein
LLHLQHTHVNAVNPGIVGMTAGMVTLEDTRASPVTGRAATVLGKKISP